MYHFTSEETAHGNRLREPLGKSVLESSGPEINVQLKISESSDCI